MSAQTPEQIASRVNGLGSKVERMQSSTRLSSLKDDVEDLDTRLAGLPACIQEIRLQGFVFGKDIESRAESFAGQWRKIRPGVLYEIERQSPRLAQKLPPLQNQLAQVKARLNAPSSVQYAVEKLDKDLELLESEVRAAESAVRGLYDSFSTEVSQFQSRLDRTSKMLAQFAAASFRLLPTEGMIMAVKAVFSRDAKMENEDPDGFLFLTDQRLLFEQNEEVATKKVLFVTTEKKKVQQLLLEVPLALIEKVQPSKKGIFGHQDHLELSFCSGAPYYQVWLHLDGQDCNEWQVMIGNACSGGFDDDRAVAIDADAVRRVQAAPGACPNCGAPLTQVVLRGMDSIQCEYCQHVIRL